ncbi:MAG: InlB B-repeat-containing protein [Dorea sp.]|nr:InlB B-repeat-containing protein [Dorea sp.]
MKSLRKIAISILAILILLCIDIPESKAANLPPVRANYGTGSKIVISKNEFPAGEKATIKVKMKADDKNYKSRKLVKLSVKSLTPKICSAKKNAKGDAATVTGKAAGTGKIKVYVEYSCKEKCYAKCLNQKPQTAWIKRTLKETKIIQFKVLKKEPSFHPIESDPVPIVGGSVRLFFEVDGIPYGNPINVGVGIAPIVDYADKFPPVPEKPGYQFDGWYTKNNQKIGTTAGEIYPAFDKIYSGQEATVHAQWVASDEVVR